MHVTPWNWVSACLKSLNDKWVQLRFRALVLTSQASIRIHLVTVLPGHIHSRPDRIDLFVQLGIRLGDTFILILYALR